MRKKNEDRVLNSELGMRNAEKEQKIDDGNDEHNLSIKVMRGCG